MLYPVGGGFLSPPRMKSATCVRLYSSSAAVRLRCLNQKNRAVTMATAATTPTTTPAAMPATFVEPPEVSDSGVGVDELLDTGSAGLVMTIVLPGDTLVTTVGGLVVVGVLLLLGDESESGCACDDPPLPP